MPDITKIEAAVQGMLDQEAVELVDVRYLNEGGRWVLRFYVDKAGGIKLDDCELLSDRIGALLEMTDLLPGRYVLEVSSPGLDRVLKKEADFRKYLGRRVKVRLKTPEQGQRNFSGVLQAPEDGHVVLRSGETVVRLQLARVDEARLDPEVDI